MKAKIVAIALGIALLFTACGGPDSGEVYSKEYRAAYTTHDMVPQYMMRCDSKGVCTQYIAYWYQQDNYHPECYKVKFRNDSGDKGDACVSPAQYDEIAIGDWYGPEE